MYTKRHVVDVVLTDGYDIACPGNPGLPNGRPGTNTQRYTYVIPLLHPEGVKLVSSAPSHRLYCSMEPSPAYNGEHL